MSKKKLIDKKKKLVDKLKDASNLISKVGRQGKANWIFHDKQNKDEQN